MILFLTKLQEVSHHLRKFVAILRRKLVTTTGELVTILTSKLVSTFQELRKKF